MKPSSALPWIALTPLMVALSGCGEHLEKKHETLISPSERGTEAEKEPLGPVRHGEAASDTGR